MNFGDAPLIVDLSGDGMKRKLEYANATNKQAAMKLEKSRLVNSSIRHLLEDAHKATMWAIDVVAKGSYQNIPKDMFGTPDLMRGIGVVCVIIGIAGSVINEAL